MKSQAQRPVSLYRTTAEVTTLVMMAAVSIMSAQNSAPSAASQAARAQKSASEASLPSDQLLVPSYVSSARRLSSGIPGEGIVYDNGPINGQTGGWEFDGLNTVSDTFTLPGSATITAISFGAWLYPNDFLYSMQVAISSQPNSGGTLYYLSPLLNPEPTGCVLNSSGYNVCTETVASGLNIPRLSPGTYWMTLESGNVSNQDPVFWDQNSGVGCTSPGCPSQAQSNYYGPIPSESFTLLGNSSPPPQCFRPSGNLQVLYNFTQQQTGTSGQDGVVIDRAGNLYGAFPGGGDHSAGFVFKLSRSATGR